MRRLSISALALAVISLLAAPALGASNQVSICHATGSTTNPYVLIHPAAAGVVNGHLGHQDARDVIPPFTYKGVSYSLNWNPAGQELFAGGCKPVSTPPGDGGGGSF
jgi:hypothetical protein